MVVRISGARSQSGGTPIPRVLIRLVTSPHDARGELLVVYVDSRTVSSPEVCVYSVTKDEWRIEHHRHLMWRTHRANPTEREIARQSLDQMGEQVRMLQAAPRALDPPQPTDPTDQSPAFDEVSVDTDGT